VPKVVILGAGLTGLSLAYNLEQNNFFDFQIYEKEDSPGGLLRSFKQDDFTFDFTGHLLHVNNEIFYNFLNKISDIKNFDLVTRRSCIHINNKTIPYPYQMNLAGLENNKIIEAINGFVNRKKSIKPKSFHDWVLKHFGAGIGKQFFFPYNQKLLAFNVKKITPSWTGRFVPKVDLKTILKGAFEQNISGIGYNNQFYYPKKDGIQFLIDKLRKSLKSKIHTNYNAKKIDIINKTVQFENGHTQKYETLITTIPLDLLLKSIKEKPNTNLKKISKKLTCNSVINFNLGFDIKSLSNKHWKYFPENKYPFYRIGFWHNINSNSAKENCSAIYGETSFIPGTKTETQINNLTKKSINSALTTLNLTKNNIVTEKLLHLPHAYVIYDFWREQNLEKLLNRLKKLSIHSIGRYGEWKYSSMQEAFLDGARAAEQILEKRGNNETSNRIL